MHVRAAQFTHATRQSVTSTTHNNSNKMAKYAVTGMPHIAARVSGAHTGVRAPQQAARALHAPERASFYMHHKRSTLTENREAGTRTLQRVNRDTFGGNQVARQWPHSDGGALQGKLTPAFRARKIVLCCKRWLIFAKQASLSLSCVAKLLLHHSRTRHFLWAATRL